jgi:DNA-binding MarR family transcriptional regulator
MEEPDFLHELRAQAAFWKHFNHYYFHRLRAIRAVNNGWGMHATELRILREIGDAENGVHNAYIAWKINVDKGQVSRVVWWFKQLGWIEERRDAEDLRIKYLALSKAGRYAYRILDQRINDATELFLMRIRREDRIRLVAVLSEVQGFLASRLY